MITIVWGSVIQFSFAILIYFKTLYMNISKRNDLQRMLHPIKLKMCKTILLFINKNQVVYLCISHGTLWPNGRLGTQRPTNVEIHGCNILTWYEGSYGHVYSLINILHETVNMQSTIYAYRLTMSSLKVLTEWVKSEDIVGSIDKMIKI